MNMPQISRITRCRCCGAEKFQHILKLPQMPFTDDFISPEKKGTEFIADIDIYRCEGCNVVQTLHNVDVGEYYEDYQYSVGGSATASRFMNELACRIKERFFPGSNGQKVLEVGSGDGGQLLAFKNTGCDVLGYEPSSMLCEVAAGKGVNSVQGLFTDSSIGRLPHNFKKVDVVMLSYTFDHLPAPRSFLRTAREVLKSDGLLIVEIHNLEKIVERKEYCLFEHEHSIYLTEATASEMCKREGLVIIDYDIVPESLRRANSLIFVAVRSDSALAAEEVAPRTGNEYNGAALYEALANRINKGIANLDKYVLDCLSKGFSVAGYGAGGRGVMSMAAMQESPKLKYLIDKKPKKEGILTPRSGVPVRSISSLKTDPVDRLIVFSFGYLVEIREELRKIGYRDDQSISLLDLLEGGRS